MRLSCSASMVLLVCGTGCSLVLPLGPEYTFGADDAGMDAAVGSEDGGMDASRADAGSDAGPDGGADGGRPDGGISPLDGCFVQAGAGFNHSCAIAIDGSLWCWGTNLFGQLGVGDLTACTTDPCDSPVRVGTDTDWVSVATGRRHTCAIRSDGSLWCWGSNHDGRLGLGDPTACGGSPDTCAAPTRVGPDTDWQAVTVGHTHTCAIKADGSLWCWGANGNGALGVGDTDSRDAPTRVGSAENWETVSGGSETFAATCGVRSDGSLWCWGSNVRHQLGLGDASECGGTGQCLVPTRVGSDSDWADVSVGPGSSPCAVKSDGSLWCWGSNAVGQLGLGDASHCGGTGQCSRPTRVGADSDWSSVSMAIEYGCAIRGSGELWCWGVNDSGQLGVGDTDSRPAPLRVGSESDWVSVTVEHHHACAVRGPGWLYCWGSDAYGALGTSSVDARSLHPDQVPCRCLAGGCQECGARGEPCCSAASVCEPDAVCSDSNPLDGTCNACGSPGEACCVRTDACASGAMCDDPDPSVGRCPSCGGTDQPCCTTGESCTASGTVCDQTDPSLGTCVACGGLGQPCCESGSGCDSGIVCGDTGTCVTCGAEGEPCCTTGTACTATATQCDDADPSLGTCVHCGALGEICCTSSPLLGGSCGCSGACGRFSGVCEECGGSGQRCCSSDVACTGFPCSGGACTGGTCP